MQYRNKIKWNRAHGRLLITGPPLIDETHCGWDKSDPVNVYSPYTCHVPFSRERTHVTRVAQTSSTNWQRAGARRIVRGEYSQNISVEHDRQRFESLYCLLAGRSFFIAIRRLTWIRSKTTNSRSHRRANWKEPDLSRETADSSQLCSFETEQ